MRLLEGTERQVWLCSAFADEELTLAVTSYFDNLSNQKPPYQSLPTFPRVSMRIITSNNFLSYNLTSILILSSLSFSTRQTAASLELESGLQLESTSIASFRQAVLNGDWKVCEKLLLKGLKEAKIRLASRLTRDEQFQSSNLIESDGESEWESVLREPTSKGLDVSCWSSPLACYFDRDRVETD